MYQWALKKPQLNRRPGSQVILIKKKRIFPQRRTNPIAPLFCARQSYSGSAGPLQLTHENAKWSKYVSLYIVAMLSLS